MFLVAPFAGPDRTAGKTEFLGPKPLPTTFLSNQRRERPTASFRPRLQPRVRVLRCGRNNSGCLFAGCKSRCLLRANQANIFLYRVVEPGRQAAAPAAGV